MDNKLNGWNNSLTPSEGIGGGISALEYMSLYKTAQIVFKELFGDNFEESEYEKYLIAEDVKNLDLFYIGLAEEYLNEASNQLDITHTICLDSVEHIANRLRKGEWKVFYKNCIFYVPDNDTRNIVISNVYKFFE